VNEGEEPYKIEPLQRAAEEARRIAIQTNTAIVVKVNGEIKHISAAELMATQQ
jgi:precorrin-2 methylase